MAAMLALPTVFGLPAKDINWFWTFLFLSIGFYLFSIISVRFPGPKTHLVGLHSLFEPRVVANYRFFKDAAAVINEGYTKVIAFLPQMARGCSRLVVPRSLAL